MARRKDQRPFPQGLGFTMSDDFVMTICRDYLGEHEIFLLVGIFHFSICEISGTKQPIRVSDSTPVWVISGIIFTRIWGALGDKTTLFIIYYDF